MISDPSGATTAVAEGMLADQRHQCERNNATNDQIKERQSVKHCNPSGGEIFRLAGACLSAWRTDKSVSGNYHPDQESYHSDYCLLETNFCHISVFGIKIEDGARDMNEGQPEENTPMANPRCPCALGKQSTPSRCLRRARSRAKTTWPQTSHPCRETGARKTVSVLSLADYRNMQVQLTRGRHVRLAIERRQPIFCVQPAGLKRPSELVTFDRNQHQTGRHGRSHRTIKRN